MNYPITPTTDHSNSQPPLQASRSTENDGTRLPNKLSTAQHFKKGLIGFFLLTLSSLGYANPCDQTYPQLDQDPNFYEFQEPLMLSKIQRSRINALFKPLETTKWIGQQTQTDCKELSGKRFHLSSTKDITAQLSKGFKSISLSAKLRNVKNRSYRIEIEKLNWSNGDLRQRLSSNADKVQILQLLPNSLITLYKYRQASITQRNSSVRAILKTYELFSPTSMRITTHIFHQEQLASISVWELSTKK